MLELSLFLKLIFFVGEILLRVNLSFCQSIIQALLRFLSTAEPWLSIVQIFDKVLRYFDKRRSLSKTYLAIFGATLATFFKHMVTLVPRYSASHSPYPEMNQFLMNF